MAYFEDLSPYTYFEDEVAYTVNIGWLNPGHPFPTGETSEAFKEKLSRLCSRPVNQTCGSYFCCWCNARTTREASTAEMRVAGSGKIYAAPLLVHHYVAAHGYKPPDEFIAAVLAWEE